MPGAMAFLFFAKLRNWIKGFVRRPARLIFLAAIAALIALTVVGGNSAKPGSEMRDVRQLAAYVTLFYSSMFVMFVGNGFKNGATMFSMADVNLVFTAPFSPRKVLFYGLFRQLANSFLVGVFILFQYSWLHGTYGVGYDALLLILLGYALTVFFGQITAMVIYSFTSADDRKKNVVKAAVYAAVGLFAVYLAANCLGDMPQLLPKFTEVASGTVARLFPVGGWLGWIVSETLQGGACIAGAALCLAYLAILVCLIGFSKQDYYEDVLKSTEIVQSAITARKEGVAGEPAPVNVRVGRTGIGGGWGSSAIYFKHRVENRRSRVLLFGAGQLTFMAITVAMAFFLREAGFLSFFVSATFMQVFTVAMGRFYRELTKPYIYLIPEPPLKKLLFGLLESLPSSAAEAAAVMVPAGLILGMTPPEVAMGVVARLSFAFLFTAGNVAVERLWGGTSPKALAVFFYFGILIVLAAPGAIASAALAASGAYLVSAKFVAMLALSACNIVLSALVFYLCRDMLQYAELNQR